MHRWSDAENFSFVCLRVARKLAHRLTDRQTDRHGDNISVFFPLKKALKTEKSEVLTRLDPRVHPTRGQLWCLLEFHTAGCHDIDTGEVSMTYSGTFGLGPLWLEKKSIRNNGLPMWGSICFLITNVILHKWPDLKSLILMKSQIRLLLALVLQLAAHNRDQSLRPLSFTYIHVNK